MEVDVNQFTDEGQTGANYKYRRLFKIMLNVLDIMFDDTVGYKTIYIACLHCDKNVYVENTLEGKRPKC